MKKFILLMLLSIAPIQCAVAQSAGAAAGSNSQSGAQSSSQSGSIGYGIGVGGSAGASANNAGNSQAITFNSKAVRQYKNTPGLVAPALASTLTDTCMGSVTGGVAGAGFGITAGKTYVDQECVRRLHAKFLATAGQGAIAMQIMCGSKFVSDASAKIARATGEVDTCVGEKVEKPSGPTPKDKHKWSYPQRDDDDGLFD